MRRGSLGSNGSARGYPRGPGDLGATLSSNAARTGVTKGNTRSSLPTAIAVLEIRRAPAVSPAMRARSSAASLPTARMTKFGTAPLGTQQYERHTRLMQRRATSRMAVSQRVGSSPAGNLLKKRRTLGVRSGTRVTRASAPSRSPSSARASRSGSCSMRKSGGATLNASGSAMSVTRSRSRGSRAHRSMHSSCASLGAV